MSKEVPVMVTWVDEVVLRVGATPVIVTSVARHALAMHSKRTTLNN